MPETRVQIPAAPPKFAWVIKMFRYTRFEKARIIGARALQIAMGAPVLINVPEGASPLDAAIVEFEKGIIPITVIRPS
ncbi:DNA-directed RNA polymerase subunit K [Thermococcus sibiricus MM 739]|uniref:DNA-directed RNA polymerase subunit Rpo6 n=3 Tax=Thermococcaceae TaxID=2259 RepID=C6A1B8_THESM|nr:DNA-directed RNA polymerase subunit K [Thermococcus sibiricus MM 739]